MSEGDKEKPSEDFQDVRDEKYQRGFMERLWLLHNTPLFTDMVLRAGEKQFPCHRVVLAAASEYFRVMFGSGMEESNSNNVEIKGTDPETLSTILHYVYTGNIHITTNNVQDLVQTSDLFNLSDLVTTCEDFMIRQVCPSNCIGFYEFSTLYRLTRLKETARSIMLTEFSEVVRSSEFCSLSVEGVTEYISDSDLSVKTEDDIFVAVSTWVSADSRQREPSFPRLAENIRFSYCTSQFLKLVVEPSPLMSHPECRKLLAGAQACPSNQNTDEQTMAPRTSFLTRSLVLIGGLTASNAQSPKCWYMQPGAENWELLTELPKQIASARWYSAVGIKAGIIITGGNYQGFMNLSYVFNMNTMKWFPMKRFSEGRSSHASIQHQGCIYIIGGYGESGPLNSVERCEAKTLEWKVQPPLPKALICPLVAGHCDHIYVFGGMVENGTYSESTVAYDTKTEKWESRQDMPLYVSDGDAVIVNDKIYAVGGFTLSCMSYCIKSDSWTVLTPPKHKHGSAPAVLWQGKILVGGGQSEKRKRTAVVEQYNIDSDTWTYWDKPLKEELQCHHLLSVHYVQS